VRCLIGGDWKKFLVIDAGNEYIALKSFNGNNYLRFQNQNTLGNADTPTIDDYSRSQ
jgi:hypothetical protein